MIVKHLPCHRDMPYHVLNDNRQTATSFNDNNYSSVTPSVYYKKLFDCLHSIKHYK